MTTRLVSSNIAPILMLFARVVLFGLLQALFVASFSLSWVESIPWWPIVAVLTNVVCFIILSVLARQENMTYLDIIHFHRRKIRQDFKAVWWVFIVGGVVGGIGMYGFAFLMYGGFNLPDNMIQPLPTWAAIIGLILFPITNAMVEIPLYMGYCLPRLEVRFGSRFIALSLTAFFLAFQHVTLPITVDDFKFMVWHFVSMIPLAVAVGVIYVKVRRLLPIMIVHYIMDIMAILGLVMMSI